MKADKKLLIELAHKQLWSDWKQSKIQIRELRTLKRN